MSSGNNTGIKRSINALIRNRGIDSNIARHVRENGGMCFWCGTSLEGQTGVNGAHADHVVPRAKGGGDNIANLVPSCSACNRKKRSADPVEYAKAVGADVEAVQKIVAAHRAEQPKKITVLHLESYSRDAYIFRGYDGEMIDAIKQVVCVDFHVLLNGYRAFTAPCFSYEYLEGEFEFLGYELIDRRDTHCREIDWGA